VPNEVKPTDGERKVDPNIQIKFTIIFGILAFIPFVLFYFYGLEVKPEKPVGDGTGVAVPQVTFTEVARAAGIDFVHVNGAAGEKLLPETMGGGCAFFDMDGDGDQDVVFINSMGWGGTNGTNGAEEGSAAASLHRSAAASLHRSAAASHHRLYANDGKGEFTDVTAGSGLDFASYGMGVATGDFDGDGKTDLFVTGVNGPGLPRGNRLLRNLGDGKFADVSEAMGIAGTNAWSTSATFVDYDRDGDLDLFVCNYVQWSREIDLQVDYRLPSVGRAYGPPMSFAGTFPVLYRNDGGKFVDVSAAAGIQIRNKATGLPMAKSLGVSPVDLDNDGWIDLVVANDTVQNFVFHNNKDGTFSEVGGQSGVAYDRFGSTRGAMGIDTGRFHNDDTLAISIGNFANEMTAFYVASQDPLFFSDEALNVGIGDATRGLLTFGVFFFDYDLNGYLDLLTANGHIEPEIGRVHPNQSYAQPVQLFWNSGQSAPAGGTASGFRLVTADRCGADLHQPMVGRGSAFADIDGDGDQDVLVTQLNGPAKLFRNDQQLGNSWVRVKLVGKKSNRDAIGASVKVRVGNRVFSQQVMPTRGYLSQSELPVTIGLGKAQKIDDVQIFWPDGTRETGVALKLNSVNVVTQK
jgi:hypothetical protein